MSSDGQELAALCPFSHELTSLETSASQPIFKTPGANHILSVEFLHVNSHCHCVHEAKTHCGLVDLPMPDPNIFLPQAGSPTRR